MGKKQRRSEKDVPVAEPLPEERAMDGPTPKFGRALASNDKDVRDKAVKALQQYLSSADDITEPELRKIWKALYFCFWHSDKPKVQADLAERLAGMMHVMPHHTGWLFVRVFWATMTREWTLIDRLRLDKFYMLMRTFLAHTLQRVGQERWADGEVEAFAAVLGSAGGPAEPKAPTGVRYFLADSFLPALRHALAKSAKGGASAASGGGGRPAKRGRGAPSALPALLLSDSALLALLEPFVVLLGAADDDAMLQRLVDGVVQPLLADATKGKGSGDDDDDDLDIDGSEADESDVGAAKDEDDTPPAAALPRPLAALAERLFTLASQKGTKDRNRPLIYALQQRVEAMAAASAQADTAKAATAPASAKGTPGKKRKATASSLGSKDVAATITERPAANPKELAALRQILAKPKPTRGTEAAVGAKKEPTLAKRAKQRVESTPAEPAESEPTQEPARKPKKASGKTTRRRE